MNDTYSQQGERLSIILPRNAKIRRIFENIRFRREWYESLSSPVFRDLIEKYSYDRSYLRDLASTQLHGEIFKPAEDDINFKPVLHYLPQLTADHSRKPFAVYEYSDPLGRDISTEIDISVGVAGTPSWLVVRCSEKQITVKVVVDIEFFESIPQAGALIRKSGFQYDPLGYLPDLDKLHLKLAFLCQEGREWVVPLYIGIGTNQPSHLSESGVESRERYSKYDIMQKNRFRHAVLRRQKLNESQLKQTGKAECSYSEIYSDGSAVFVSLKTEPKHKYPCILAFVRRTGEVSYAEGHEDLPRCFVDALEERRLKGRILDDFYVHDDSDRFLGIYETSEPEGRFDRSWWRQKVMSLHIDYADQRLEPAKELDSFLTERDGISFVEHQIMDLDPDYDKYLRVFHDPFRLIQKHGYRRILHHLMKLGSFEYWGRIGLQEVAAELFKASYPEERRGRGIPLLFMQYTRSGRLAEIIRKQAASRLHEVIPLQ